MIHKLFDFFLGPAFVCKPAFQGSAGPYPLHCFATRLWRALPIGGRLGWAKARLFFATILFFLLPCPRQVHPQERRAPIALGQAEYTEPSSANAGSASDSTESTSVNTESASANTEHTLKEREEYLEHVQTYNFWSTLGQQFKISSESEPELKSSFGFDFLTMFYERKETLSKKNSIFF